LRCSSGTKVKDGICCVVALFLMVLLIWENIQQERPGFFQKLGELTGQCCCRQAFLDLFCGQWGGPAAAPQRWRWNARKKLRLVFLFASVLKWGHKWNILKWNKDEISVDISSIGFLYLQTRSFIWDHVDVDA
jgi:hypothetical protein